jgi:uncharacterized protein (DUF4415 family)
MNKEPSKHLTAKQKAQLEALSTLPDDEIDTDDIPEVQDWSGAKRGLFYRPIKPQITLRLDASNSKFRTNLRRFSRSSPLREA